MRNETVAPLRARILACVLALALALGMSPVLSPQLAWAEDPTPDTTQADTSGVNGQPGNDENGLPGSTGNNQSDTADSNPSGTPTSNGDDDTNGNPAGTNPDDENGAQEDQGAGLSTDPTEGEDANDQIDLADAGQVPALCAETGIDQEKLNTLVDNLAARFSKGSDLGQEYDYYGGSSTNAAMALKALGKASQINTAAALAAYAEHKNDSDMGAGKLAKIIITATAGGVDCTKANINGEEVDLVAIMDEKASIASDPWSDPFILQAHTYGNYPIPQTLFGQLTERMVSCVNGDGLYEAYGYADTETTAQVLRALLPYTNISEIATAVSKLKTGVSSPARKAADGGFAGWDGNGDVSTTGDALDALHACSLSDEDAAAFLVNSARETLDGYDNQYSEPLADSLALLGLIPYVKETPAPVNPAPVKPAPKDDKKPADNATPSHDKKANTDETAEQTSDTPQTGDDLIVPAALALLALAAGGTTAGAAIRRRQLSRK